MSAPGTKTGRWQRLFSRTLPLIALLTALLVALFLVSGVQQAAARPGTGFFGDSYLWVLIVTLLALAVLLWSIASRLLTLVRSVRGVRPGALLAARWVRNFLALSLPPALIVFVFSAWFLSSTIDSWFDVRVEEALADSLQLGKEFLDTRTLEVRNQLREIAGELTDAQGDSELLRRALLERVRSTGPTELSVLETDGTLVATANIGALTAMPERPPDFAALQAVQQGEYAAAEPGPTGDIRIRVVQLLPPSYPGATPRLLQAIYPLPKDLTSLAESIEREYYRYQNVSYLRHSLKQSFLLILTLVLLLTVLLAILAALNAARRMVNPLSRLSQATREVAAGDLDRQVEAEPRDEIGFLVESFNRMTQALKAASQEAEASRAELQAQGEYLETVLGNLSSGVLTVDEDGNVVTMNESGRQILGLGKAPASGHPLAELLETMPFLNPFVDTILRYGKRGSAEWQQEIKIERPGKPLVLLARGSRLPAAALPGDHPGFGQVVVFDDVTVLDQAQREAAWAEAARRLAHEVKNPLTPIRLAAERLRMKLAARLDGQDGEILERASTTIVAQVEALRKLVDAFGDYAREPELTRKAVQLDDLLREVVELYQQGDSPLRFELDLCEGPDGLEADAGRLRQMLHNLIRNAGEAVGGAGTLRITSGVVEENGRPWLRLELQDDGPGFPAMVLENPFEPYVTNKARGSGLGLAICRKIVTEHDGRIELTNPPAGGARVTIHLPLTAAIGG